MKSVILDEVKFEVKSLHFSLDSKTAINCLKNEAMNADIYIEHMVNEIRRS